MTVVRGAFADYLAPGAYATYEDEYEALPASYPDVFNILTTKRAYEDVVISSGLGTTPRKPEAQDVALDEPLPVGKVRMSVVGYGLGYEVSHEFVEDNLYGFLTDDGSRMLAQSGRDTEERQAWAILNNAFTTQLTYDGQPIVSTAHPLRGGGTYSNKSATSDSLSFTGLQASLERHMLMINERGLRLRQAPAMLIVPVQLSWLANELLGSSMKPFEASNTENVLAAGKVGLRVISSPYLTSTTAWFTLARKHRLNFFWREKPNMHRDYDERARVALFMNFFRFGTAAFDWRGLDASTG